MREGDIVGAMFVRGAEDHDSQRFVVDAAIEDGVFVCSDSDGHLVSVLMHSFSEEAG
jgi:hypothetical protein